MLEHRSLMLNLASQITSPNGKAARVDYSPRPNERALRHKEEATVAGGLFFDFIKDSGSPQWTIFASSS